MTNKGMQLSPRSSGNFCVIVTCSGIADPGRSLFETNKAMPNGDDKNWIRVCCSIDGFRARYGRWPLRVRIMPISYIDIIDHILSPIGFALISSHVALVCEEDAEMVSEDDDGNSHNYGSEGGGDISDRTIDFFGQAVLR